jgi:hypothetical protein
MAFGNFTWIFVILFIFGVAFTLLKWLSPSWWMLILLAFLAVPRIFISIARPLWNAVKSTRYQRLDLNRFREWWERFSNSHELPPRNLNIVYGHTHLIDDQSIEKPEIRFLNIPAWVKDKRSQGKRENVLQAAFLYIDEEGSKFMGWDWKKSSAFFIPDKIIAIRRKGEALTMDDKKRLKAIGWPDTLLKEWEKPLPAEELKRTMKEALTQELKR